MGILRKLWDKFKTKDYSLKVGDQIFFNNEVYRVGRIKNWTYSDMEDWICHSSRCNVVDKLEWRKIDCMSDGNPEYTIQLDDKWIKEKDGTEIKDLSDYPFISDSFKQFKWEFKDGNS